MHARRLGNMLRRDWLVIVVVLAATLAGSLAWNIWGPGNYIAEAEVLVAAKIPSGAGAGQYDVELSRASTSNFIVDDLGRVVQGNAFAGLIARRYQEESGAEIDPDRLAGSLSIDRSHRGLKVILRWPDAHEAGHLIDLTATALAEDSRLFYPTIDEVADIAIIDLSSAPRRPGMLAATFDIALKLASAAILIVAVIVWRDYFRGRLYSEDVDDLLGIKVLARID